jgi:hypothetical protein
LTSWVIRGEGSRTRYSATHQLVRIVLQSLVTGPDWITGCRRSLRLSAGGAFWLTLRDQTKPAQVPIKTKGEAVGLVRTTFNQATGSTRIPRFYVSELESCGGQNPFHCRLGQALRATQRFRCERWVAMARATLTQPTTTTQIRPAPYRSRPTLNRASNPAAIRDMVKQKTQNTQPANT